MWVSRSMEVQPCELQMTQPPCAGGMESSFGASRCWLAPQTAWSSQPGRKLGSAGVSGIQRLEHIVAKRREHVNMCSGGCGTNPQAPMLTFFFSRKEGELFLSH